MIKIDKDVESIVTSPFQEEVVPENYFACANRGESLSQMKEAVLNGVELMVLTGEEGSGKTMICRLLEHELSPLCPTVFFPQAVDSFEDVIQIVAARLGLDEVMEMEALDIDLALEQIADVLLDESVDLCIIFDEAENLFLATLERIRKMLDRIIGSGARICILFSGRETLLENCDQLSLCDFQNTDELHFDLIPLSKVETADYLKNCCSRLADLDATKVFSDEVVHNIYSLAKGNFRMTNILGEESVKTHSADTSFMVLLDGVKDGYGTEAVPNYATKYSHLIDKFVSYLPWIGGVCSLVLLIFLLGDDETVVDPDLQQKEKSVQIETVTVRQANVSSPEQLEPAEKVQPPEENMAAGQVPEQTVRGDEGGEVLPVELPLQQESGQQKSVVSSGAAEEIEPVGKTEEVETGAVEKAEEIETGTVGDAGEKVIVEAEEMQPSQEAAKSEVVTIVKLRPAPVLKKKPAPSSELQRLIIKVQSHKEVRSGVVSNGNYVDQLFNERVLAGLGWKKSDKENTYTVQLMALASKNAENNLKKMLSQVTYRQEAGNFYIFRKATAPDNIFVFYGEYPSAERARLVKNSLPKFLRDHKPYVLSIKGAIAKVKK